MSQRNVLILERSNQNLRKVNDKGKVELEGVFAEFGVENRNGRVYEEKEYLPHLEYLKKDITNGNLLGELDHPERFEVALANVSHRVNELWYDQASRQIKGRIEILDTPKGQIAKSLLEASVPLSISSRAAGTVNEDKTVQIQQIYTYDLVAKPGFESAQLNSVNESAKARINNFIKQLNESYQSKFGDSNICSELGIVNENISILDVTDKFPSVKLREEAKSIVKNKNEEIKIMEEKINEQAIQQWTLFVKKELSNLNEKIKSIESSILEGKSGVSSSEELQIIKEYVEKLRKIQEQALNWQSNIAKAVNEVASYADMLAEKSNNHYKLTKKIAETVDHNAKTLNATQDWVGHNAKVTNVIAETVDHNAEMLNGVNEWNGQISRAVNALHEWGSEKAKAINGIHEWTSSIAENVNLTSNWAEDMFGRAMSKEDAKNLIKYIELVSESKANPELKKKLDEALNSHGITGKPLNEEAIIKGLSTITDVKTVGKANVKTDAGVVKDIDIDEKTKTIVAKIKNVKFSKGAKPKELKTLTADEKSAGKISGGSKVKGVMTLDTVKGKSKPVIKISGGGPKSKDQNLKLDTKPEGKLKEGALNKVSIVKQKSAKLDEKLGKIIQTLEKEKKVDEETKNQYPFTQLLSESDRKGFTGLSQSDKEKVAKEIEKNPSIDSNVIKGLMENALQNRKEEEPLWLKVAPKKYKEAYEKANDLIKESIKAKSEFYVLESQYQINYFWETLGLIENKITSLNEAVYAKTPEESEAKMDDFVKSIGEQMKKYNS